MDNYWTICVEEALSDVGVETTPDQLSRLTDLLRNAGEMEREASGVYEINRPSQITPPKRGMSEPYRRGGRYYMDGSPPDESWSVTDQDTKQTFYFDSERAARRFHELNA